MPLIVLDALAAADRRWIIRRSPDESRFGFLTRPRHPHVGNLLWARIGDRHVSAGAKTTFRRVAEKYFIQGDCANCGAKNNEIQDWNDGKGRKKRSISPVERLARLRETGLPTVIER